MILYNNAYEIMTCTLCQSFSETCFVAGSVKKCIMYCQQCYHKWLFHRLSSSVPISLFGFIALQKIDIFYVHTTAIYYCIFWSLLLLRNNYQSMLCDLFTAEQCAGLVWYNLEGYAISTFSEKGDQLQKRDIIFLFDIWCCIFFLTYNISSYYTQF